MHRSRLSTARRRSRRCRCRQLLYAAKIFVVYIQATSPHKVLLGQRSILLCVVVIQVVKNMFISLDKQRAWYLAYSLTFMKVQESVVGIQLQFPPHSEVTWPLLYLNSCGC